MTRVRIIRSCAIEGNHIQAGDSADVKESVAQELIGMGKAVREESNRAVGLKNSDGPKMKKRKQ